MLIFVSLPLLSVAIFGLLFFAYAILRILATWERRDRLNLAIWFIVLSLIGGISIGLLGRWSWLPIVALLALAVSILVWSIGKASTGN